MKRFIRLPWGMVTLSTLIVIAFLLTTIGFSGEEAMKCAASPKVIAVKFHADW